MNIDTVKFWKGTFVCNDGSFGVKGRGGFGGF